LSYRDREYSLAILFIAAGLFFLLLTLGILDLGKWWPLILIGIGLLIIWARYYHSFRSGVGDRVWHRFLGDIRLGEREWTLEDATVETGLGNVRIDLAKASITPGQHRLHIYGWMGKIEISVPENLAVSARGTVSLGTVTIMESKREGFFPELALTSPNYDAAETRLEIKMSLLMGDVSLRRSGGP